MAHEYGGIPATADRSGPDVFADEAVGFESANGTIRITLASFRMSEPVPPSPAEVSVVGRLVMTIPGAQRLALGLFDYLKREGFDPASLISDSDQKPN